MSLQERKRKKRIKEYVINRDGNICCYCDKILSSQEITLDHIMPDSNRGTFNATNLTVACSNHNNERGSKPFFEYCKKFNWPESKLNKYKKLYSSNLKIKILNIAKEECMIKIINDNNQAIPNVIIEQACNILKINNVSFEDYNLGINFSESLDKKHIKFNFEKLIRMIEASSVDI